MEKGRPLEDLFAEHENRWVYHASPHIMAEGFIEPRYQRKPDGKWGHYVFATNHLKSAVSYAMKTDDMLSCDISIEEGTDNTYCIFQNRTAFMQEERQGYIYRLPHALFQQAFDSKGEMTTEFVCADPVPVQPEHTFLVSGFSTLIDHGVHVFFLKDGVTRNMFFEQTTPEMREFESMQSHPLCIWVSQSPTSNALVCTQ